MAYQKTIIHGNIGRIEQRFSASGDSVVNFSVAVSEKYKKKDGTQVESTEWFNCVSFGKQSEVIFKYFEKGSQIIVEGKNKTTEYTNDHGEKKRSTQLKVSEFSFCGSRDSNQSEQRPTPQQGQINQSSAPQRPQQTAQSSAHISDDLGDSIPF